MEPDIHYPRVLILGTTFDTVTGGGITLTNLFRGWPSDRLALASFDPCLVDPPPAAHQFRLGAEERPWIPLLRFARFMDLPHGGPVPLVSPASLAPTVAKAGGEAPGGRLRPLAKKAFHGMVALLGSEEHLRTPRASERLVSWAAAFQPDLLYTQLGDWSTVLLTRDLAAALRVPVAIHMMDDWPDVIYRRGLLHRRLQRRAERELRALIGKASARMAIGDAMADEYTIRYGGEWSYFHNPVEPERWRVPGPVAGAGPAGPSAPPPRDFTLVYSGRIGAGIESSVLDVCKVVARLRGQGRRVRLAIHSFYFEQRSDPRFAAFDGVEVHGAIPEADMPATLCAADALILPFDFHGDSADYARLSFPTKAPAYEATGVPIVVYAPAAHAVAADASARGWGLVVGEPDLGALETAIARVMDDADLRARLSRQALEDVAERHEAGGVRARFAAALAEAAASRPLA